MATNPRVVWLVGGVRTELHLVGHQTGGAFCMLVDHPPPGWSLPTHRHRNEAETIYIIEGTFSMEVEGERWEMGPGDSVHVPQGVIHAGGNIGSEVGRRLIVFSPAGIEGFFEEAGKPTPDDLDRRTAHAVAIRFGWDFVGGVGTG